MAYKRTLVIIIAALAVLVFVYRLLSDEWKTDDRSILFVPKTIDENFEFWKVMKQGVDAAAKEYGAEVQVAGTATETDTEGQIRILEQAIADRPNAILLAATDFNRLVPVAREITEADITLITVDSGLNGDISSSFIATDNYEAGLKASEALLSSIESDETIAVVSFVKASATAMAREAGVKDGFKAAPDVRVLDTLYSDASDEKAYDIVKALLQKNERIGGIIGLNEPSAVGAGKAIRDLNKSGLVKLVGFDSSMDEIAMLEEGIIQALIVQKPFNMGYLAVKTAIEAIEGKKVGKRIDTGSEVITKENMYSSENQKLLFPFVEK